MNLSRFIALRIYRNSEPGKQVSRPAVLIAMVGIALGLAVMIIAVSVIVGFKSEVRDKIVGFGAHIQIGNLDAAQTGVGTATCGPGVLPVYWLPLESYEFDFTFIPVKE